MSLSARGAVALIGILISASPALADNWEAVRLRGTVLQLVDGEWLALHRGDVVPDDRQLQTSENGHVALERGAESIELGPNTRIQILDQGGARPFTTVTEYFGTVSVEAEVQNVEHFAVETPYLAAVVKGTRFVVTSGDKGASVEVRRGHVAVEDKETKNHVTVGARQRAAVDANNSAQLTVSGEGKLPVVLDVHNQPVVKAAEKKPEPTLIKKPAVGPKAGESTPGLGAGPAIVPKPAQPPQPPTEPKPPKGPKPPKEPTPGKEPGPGRGGHDGEGADRSHGDDHHGKDGPGKDKPGKDRPREGHGHGKNHHD